MARRRASRKKRDNDEGAASPPRLSRATIGAICGVLAFALGAVAISLAAAFLWRTTSQRPEFMLTATAISINECPSWVERQDMTEQLRKELAALEETVSIFEPDLADRVQHELRASPWVLDVPAVRRVLPNRLSVKMVFRRPAAVVKLRDQDLEYLVDRDGYWLQKPLFLFPPDWIRNREPFVYDDKLDLAPVSGKAWGQPKIAVGARLCEFLRRSDLLKKLTLLKIDVTNVGSDGTGPDIVLYTRDNVTIKWGQSDAYRQVRGLQPSSLAYSDKQKLTMLERFLADYPGLEGVEYIDLRFNKGVLTTQAEPVAGRS